MNPADAIAYLAVFVSFGFGMLLGMLVMVCARSARGD